MHSLPFDHQLQTIYGQLQWIEIRTKRIYEGLCAHFGQLSAPAPAITLEQNSFWDIIDDREPENFLRDLGHSIRAQEAKQISHYRQLSSKYKSHTDEQIIFYSRSVGQDAARSFLSTFNYPENIELPTILLAIERLCYFGLPRDNNHFATIRPLSDFSLHFQKCPSTAAWIEGGGDPIFLDEMEKSWILGILDILAPKLIHQRRYSIPKGHPFGLDFFSLSH